MTDVEALANHITYHNRRDLVMARISGSDQYAKKINALLAINLLLALQPDLPMMALFNSVTLVMAAVSRAEKRWKTVALLAMLIAGFLAAGFLGNGRSWQNIRIIYDYRQDPFGVGFEARRSIEDVRSGGLTGQGFGSYPMPVEDRPAYILPNTVSTFMLRMKFSRIYPMPLIYLIPV